jgi:DNA-binding PadR family transcriptional regulator
LRGQGWGDKPRRRRGDIKFILLSLIAERPQHGYELIKELEKRRGGFRRLSPGSVYPNLQMLEEGGYLTSAQVEDKRVYTITDSGQQLLHEHQSQAESTESTRESHEQANAESASELVQLRQTLTTLNEAVAQLAQVGSPEQIKQGSERLDQLRREIYALLAQ